MKNKKSVEEAIIDLYIHLKKDNMLDEYDQHKIKIEKEKLKKINSHTILDYIKTSFEIVSDLKAKNQIEFFLTQTNLNLKNDHEELMREAEHKIRKLFRIRMKFQISSESLKQKIEELEKSKLDLTKNLKLNSQLTDEKKEKEITELKLELENQKFIVGSYQGLNSKLTECEMKLRSQNIKHEKEIKSLDLRYRQRIYELNKVVTKNEEMLKNTNCVKESLNDRTEANLVSFNAAKIENLKVKANIIPERNNSLRNSFSHSLNRSSSYIEEEEEISHLNFEDKRYSKEPVIRSNEIKESIPTSRVKNPSMILNSIPRPNKEVDLAKSSKINLLPIVTKNECVNVNKFDPNESISENKLKLELHELNNSTGFFPSSTSSTLQDNKRSMNNDLQTAQSPHPSRQNKLFYKKRNPLVQSAEYNVNALKEQFNSPNLKSEANNIPQSLYRFQKEQNDSSGKSQTEIDEKYSEGNFSVLPRPLIRQNSLNSIKEDVGLLKSNFYKKNTQPSSKALMIARLNKSKNNQAIKKNKNSSNNFNHHNQSELLEIQEHLDKVKIPLKKSRSSISLKKHR